MTDPFGDQTIIWQTAWQVYGWEADKLCRQGRQGKQADNQTITRTSS